MDYPLLWLAVALFTGIGIGVYGERKMMKMHLLGALPHRPSSYCGKSDQEVHIKIILSPSGKMTKPQPFRPIDQIAA